MPNTERGNENLYNVEVYYRAIASVSELPGTVQM